MRRSLFALLTGLMFIGCQGGHSDDGAGADSTESGEKKITIAVIPKGTTHEFWKSVHYGAEQAARELGNVTIAWEGPQQENDREGQITVVENFISKKVDGICLAPLDSQAMIDPVTAAVESDIPVVIFDSGLDDESNIVTYVATDNYEGGAKAARRMGEVLGGKGQVIMLRYNPGSESTEKREEGFLETLAEEFPDIEVISSDEYAGTTPELSLDKATQVLGKFKDEVDGIFAVCEPNAAGTLGAIRELELADKVHLVAFDPNAALVNALKSGPVQGIVLQDPVKMGYEAVMAMGRHLKGEEVDKRIGTGEYVATPDNMNEEEMDKLLHPPQYGE